MAQTRPLFLMLSRTDTLMGQVIRSVSQYPYNHVSLTLDAGMREWYSFARYVQDAPFYGGFVKEPAERFLAKTGAVQVQIFRLDIPESRASELEQYFAGAGNIGNKRLYNYYDAIAGNFGLHMSVPNAHTCLSFACSALGQQYNSIEALSDALQPCLIYQGDLAALVPDSGDREDLYFSRMGLIRGTAGAAVQLGLLSCRLLRHGFNSYMTHRFHRTVH